MRATYRLQLTEEFGFDQARELVSYLAELGVSHLYLSPVMRARRGSRHGYDVVDPAVVSEALGGEDGLRRLSAECRAAGLGLIADFVPNHMAVSPENPYWSDPGRRQKFFDVDERSGWQRRFFTIDDLAGVRVEDPDVFEETHRKILQLVDERVIDGLRIDHPDGLADPAGYLQRLRERGVELVWVEKILEPGEQLRDWPVQGTTGYEFANDVTALFVDPRGRPRLSALYAELTGERRTFAAVAAQAKLEQARTAFAPELRKLRSLHDHPQLDAAVASLPVYRTYIEPETGRVQEADREALRNLPAELRELLLTAPGENREFVTRFQQTTGAVMAKGVEDTAFYRHLRLVALNEVGGDPDRFSVPVDAFHRANLRRAARFPVALLASQTHDTKRSGDVRARIGALSEHADEWATLVFEWRLINEPLREGPGPDPGEEYLIYQTLAGAWPIEPERLTAYLVKALREAKLNTGWDQPDEGWERSVTAFAAGLYGHDPFRRSFDPFVQRLAERGEQVSLGALLLRLTCPGVADIYQGDELSSLWLVDPDNRRPVDFEARRRALGRLGQGDVTPADRKLYLIRETLALRARRPEAFAGSYTPLPASRNVCAFTRGDQVAVIVGLRPDAPIGAVVPPGTWRELLDPAAGLGPIRLLERSMAPE